MELRRQSLSTNKSFWAAMVVQLAIFTAAAMAADSLQELEDSLTSAYAWTSWSSWGPCSLTCGGGVAVQERECLPRKRSVIKNENATGTVRIQRAHCPGVSRRYHECNPGPCSVGTEESTRDMRGEQCAAYDGRPFHGRFYNWVPYVDGNVPCMLNCRPVGQQFYASLGLVADGTPCTKPGFRAICIKGTCKAVGRESVLALAESRELQCGRRLVSGLFTRARLPLGYSYVATVPRGACRLNVTELVANDNYIALKVTNGSYLINGEFAISTPGTYDAVGARFIYSRVQGLDAIFTLGPIHNPIDIMILYTVPNPSIKYEYLTESLPGDVNVPESSTRFNTVDLQRTTIKHTRRHHGYDSYSRFNAENQHPDVIGLSKEIPSVNKRVEENIVGTRKFLWKITSYTQCSRSCGGGIQVGKFRCVEESADEEDKEISPVHCTGSAPPGRRRRCGLFPCPPRWRATPWTTCPQCGPATRTRIVGCVQDNSRGMIKVNDQRCPPPKPITIENCVLPTCPISETNEVKRVLRPREQTDTFREGPVYTITVNSSDSNLGPEYSLSASAGWLFDEWSKCVGWCVGGGVQTRSVRCSDPSGCSPLKSPEATRNCSAKTSCTPLDGHWFTGEWSACTSTCGGKQVRGVLCIGETGRHLRDSACRSPKPESERSCENNCSPAWYFSEWGQCVGNCSYGTGVQHRTVVCARGRNGANEGECTEPRPPSHRPCAPQCSTDFTEPTRLTSVTVSQITEKEITSTARSTTEQTERKDCIDKLSNCALAVQARLCHYKYYIQNCCNSCVDVN